MRLVTFFTVLLFTLSPKIEAKLYLSLLDNAVCHCCRWFNVDCSQSEDLYFLNIAVAEENAARQAER